MWQCPTCSEDNQNNDRFCNRCGRPRPAPETVSEAPIPEDDDPSTVDEVGSSSQVVTRIPVTQGIDSLLGPVRSTPIEGSESTVRLEVAGDAGAERQARNTMIEGLSAVVADAKEALAVGTDDVETQIVASLKRPSEPAEPAPAATQMIATQPRKTQATPAIPRVATESWNKETDGPRSRASVRTDPEFQAPREGPPGGWLAVVAALFVGVALASGAAAIAFFAMGDMDEATGTAPGPPTRPEPVLVAEGPFLRGLSNDYRLMFADICPKVADDPKAECKEEIALAGEYPMKEVSLPAYRIDAWEVSNDQYEACVSKGDCKPIDWSECANWNVRGLVPFLEVPQDLKQGDHPAICVTHNEAAAYCKAAGGRLPTHDEWEKAARGADAYLFPWGTNWSSTSANWGERDMARVIVAGKLDGYELTSPVWAFGDGKSPTGVYNLAGNAAEWVASGDDSINASARGGSWRSHPLEVRATARFLLKADARRTDVGFRCAYDAQ